VFLSLIADNDAKELRNVTKQDVLDLFLARVHPSASKRSKLSVHVRSQKPRPIKISTAAAQAFESDVRVAGVVVLNEGWSEELGSDQPPVTDFVKYWQGVLETSGLTPEAMKDLLMKIPPLMEKYPTEGEDDDAVRKGATYIEDVKAFKATLTVSEVPKPLEEWGDLPLSKF
jgi:insulysin